MKYLKSFNEAMEVDPSGNLIIPDYLCAYDEDDENDAFDKGMQSKENDCDIDENPYSEDDPLYYAWRDGFLN